MAVPKRQRLLLHPRTIQGIRRIGLMRKDTPALLPGYLCESCLDAPAIVLVPAPGGGEMGVCRACQRRQAAARDEEAEATRASGDHERTPDE